VVGYSFGIKLIEEQIYINIKEEYRERKMNDTIYI